MGKQHHNNQLLYRNLLDVIIDNNIKNRENVNKIVSFMEQNEKDRIGKLENVDNVTTNQRPSTTGSSFRRRFESINSTNT